RRLCLVVIVVENMLTFGLNGRGPGPARQLRRLGTERNVGIDRVGTTEPAADQHTDVATETKIEHGCGRAVISAWGLRLDLSPCLTQRLRVLAGVQLFAPLEHAHAARLGQSRPNDGPPTL